MKAMKAGETRFSAVEEALRGDGMENSISLLSHWLLIGQAIKKTVFVPVGHGTLRMNGV